MSIRHVETLRTLGFDAYIRIPEGEPEPLWLSHRAPIVRSSSLVADDVIVLPEDSINALRLYAQTPQRKVIFCQNHISAASQGLGLLSPEHLSAYRDYMACSRSVAAWMTRFVPHDTITIVPAFADEGLFYKGEKTLTVACAPAKRLLEFRAIQLMIRYIHGSKASWRWAQLVDKSESEVAETLRHASVFLSLSRLEGLGMVTLEAMSSGCLVAGFAGLGGREYAYPTNGFWVQDEDCEACAEALSKAMSFVEARHRVVDAMTDNARRAVADYSYARFAASLEAFWASRVGR